MALHMRNQGATCEIGALDPATSGTAYADVGSWTVPYFRSKIFTFSATGFNVKINVLGSRDGGTSFPAAVESAIAVNVGTDVEKVCTDPYTNLKVQVLDNSTAGHGVLATRYFGTWI